MRHVNLSTQYLKSKQQVSSSGIGKSLKTWIKDDDHNLSFISCLISTHLQLNKETDPVVMINTKMQLLALNFYWFIQKGKERKEKCKNVKVKLKKKKKKEKEKRKRGLRAKHDDHKH